MDRLDLQAQTLYAELMQRVLADELAPTVEKLGRAFVSKTIGGRTYWYLQHREASGWKQTYLGPESAEVASVIETLKQRSRSLASDIERRRALCSAIRSMGFPNWPSRLALTLETLANAGMFHNGAILIGTPAYVMCLSLAGFRSGTGTAMTGDIDVEIGRGVELLMPSVERVSVPGVLSTLKMGFFPVPGLDHKAPSTAFRVRSGDLMVQFATTPTRKGKPVFIERFGTAAQPLSYMEFLVNTPVKAALPFGAGILVNIPEPARLAWHKLIVSRKRPKHEAGKAAKDVAQAADLIMALHETAPEDLRDAFSAAYAMGPRWAVNLIAGIAALKATYPGVFELAKTRVSSVVSKAHRSALASIP